MITEKIRGKFLEFFKRLNHKEFPSSSLIPENDESLLFVNSGMVQFKDFFTGKRKCSEENNKIVTIQKCIRAGGKHNDLDNVGYTPRHHTFFEMLGNFSFGSYFKEEAIYYAWNFLISELQLDKSKILITVYYKDEESYNIWKKITNFDDSKIIKIKNKSENFWSMGDTGPCGPCCDIFYDHGESYTSSISENGIEGNRYVEIWSIVFMEMEQMKDGVITLLPKKCIDTGIGLERLSAIVHGVYDNFDIDIFKDLISFIKDSILKVSHRSINHISAYKIIADHIRAILFIISDGISPSNEGRGYVLRRIIRRTMRYLYNLNIHSPFLYTIIPYCESLMNNRYDLHKHINAVQLILKTEEEKFHETLFQGMMFINSHINSYKKNQLDKDQTPNGVNLKKMNGADAFKLYDTYGFPIDLLSDILREHKIIIDENEFNREMDLQKKRSKCAQSLNCETKFDLVDEYETKFIGYDYNSLRNISNLLSKVRVLQNDIQNKDQILIDCINLLEDTKCKMKLTNFKVLNRVDDTKFIENFEKKEQITIKENECLVVASFDQTAFYGESGGQISDSGYIININKDSEKITVIKIIDILIINKIFIHVLIINKDDVFQESDKGNLFFYPDIDLNKRKAISINHSSVHLLQLALRKVLGNTIFQKGSFVCDQKLRFDFTHISPISNYDLIKIEDIINKMIRENTKTKIELKKYSDAISDAISIMGEKYEDNVRVVSIGESSELCCGTHVEMSGEIGLFKIISESSIGSGIRRIEAFTGQNAIDFYNKFIENMRDISSLLKCNKENVINNLKMIIEEQNKLKKSINVIAAQEIANKSYKEIIIINEFRILFCSIVYSKNFNQFIINNDTNEIMSNIRKGDNNKQDISVIIDKTNDKNVSLTVFIEKRIVVDDNKKHQETEVKDLSSKAANNICEFIAKKFGGKVTGDQKIARIWKMDAIDNEQDVVRVVNEFFNLYI